MIKTRIDCLDTSLVAVLASQGLLSDSEQLSQVKEFSVHTKLRSFLVQYTWTVHFSLNCVIFIPLMMSVSFCQSWCCHISLKWQTDITSKKWQQIATLESSYTPVCHKEIPILDFHPFWIFPSYTRGVWVDVELDVKTL